METYRTPLTHIIAYCQCAGGHEVCVLTKSNKETRIVKHADYFIHWKQLTSVHPEVWNECCSIA